MAMGSSGGWETGEGGGDDDLLLDDVDGLLAWTQTLQMPSTPEAYG